MIRPVFIYSSWRTASTWVWKVFRDCPESYAYYEPYHEALATADYNQLSTLGPANWTTRSNHPDSAPYFLEFVPLLNQTGQGIKGYDSKMGIPAMFPDVEKPLPAEESAYLAGLIALGVSSNRVPIFACTRNLGRVKPTAKSYPEGVHLVTIRNLWHQWMSYCSQAEQGNNYFLNTVHEILNSCNDDPVVKRIKATYDSSKSPSSTPNLELFFAFVGIHLALYCRAFLRADLIMDVNRMERDADYRSMLSRRVRELTGVPISFDDVRCQVEYGPTPIPREEELRIRIPWLLELIFSEYHIPDDSPVRAQLTELCTNLTREIQAYEFYTKAISRAFSREKSLRLAETEARARTEATLHAEIDREKSLRLAETEARARTEATLHAEIGREKSLRLAEKEDWSTQSAALNDRLAQLELARRSQEVAGAEKDAEIGRLRQMIHGATWHTHLYRAWRVLMRDQHYCMRPAVLKRYGNVNVPWHTHLYRGALALFVKGERPWHTHLYRAVLSMVGNPAYHPSGRRTPSSPPPGFVHATADLQAEIPHTAEAYARRYAQLVEHSGV